MSTDPTIWTERARSSDALQVHMLGTVDFDAAAFLQDRLVFELSGRNDRMGGVLVCEHPPLVTVGREGGREDLPPAIHELVSRGLEVRWVNRGGGVVVHAPGQLAIYPMLPLDRLVIGEIQEGFQSGQGLEVEFVVVGHRATHLGGHSRLGFPLE